MWSRRRQRCLWLASEQWLWQSFLPPLFLEIQTSWLSSAPCVLESSSLSSESQRRFLYVLALQYEASCFEWKYNFCNLHVVPSPNFCLWVLKQNPSPNTEKYLRDLDTDRFLLRISFQLFASRYQWEKPWVLQLFFTCCCGKLLPGKPIHSLCFLLGDSR